MTGKDVLISWLNDAHSMETSLIQILEHQVKDAEGNPMVRQRLQQHLQETQQHAQIVQGCVERLGGSTSSIKSGMATLFGQFQALSTGAAQDEMVKNALADYAAENFEVASYTSLIAAAQELGELEVVTACQQILQQDQAMADWIRQNTPTLTITTLQQMAGSQASS